MYGPVEFLFVATVLITYHYKIIIIPINNNDFNRIEYQKH